MILCIVQVNIHVCKSIKICFGMITSKFRIRIQNRQVLSGVGEECIWEGYTKNYTYACSI